MLQFSKPKYVEIQQTKIRCNSASLNMLKFTNQNMLQFSKPKYVAIQHNKICCNSAQQNMLQFSTTKYAAIQHTKICCNSAQQNTLQFSKPNCQHPATQKIVMIQQTKMLASSQKK
jgi:hypothetical protein